MQARLAALPAATGATPRAATATAPPAAAPAAPAAAAAAGPAAAAAGGSGAALADYHALLSTQLVKLVDAGEAVGGQVLAATRVLAEGFQREAAVVEAMGACRKPSDAELQALVQPVGEQMMAAGDLASGPRRCGCGSVG